MTLHRRGFVLIFASWVLMFLAVLALGLAWGVRQKIIFAKRMDERSRVHSVSDAAMLVTTSFAQSILASIPNGPDARAKMALMNNPTVFQRVSINQDEAQVISQFPWGQGEHYGLEDESGKINLNTVDVDILARLLSKVLGKDNEAARRLAQSILDWRRSGESSVQGFYSDEYYSNLASPYAKKDAPYQMLEELHLVKGIDDALYEQMMPYVTVYGDGKVNINTASSAVLYALGLEDETISKIISSRRGQDGVEATSDDHIFIRTFDVASDVAAFVKLTGQDIRAIDSLNARSLLTVNFGDWSCVIKARMLRKANSVDVRMVFAGATGAVLLWKEK